MGSDIDALAGFLRGVEEFDGVVKDTYTMGNGPAVIIAAEIPGITPEVLNFARKVAGRGMTVVLPHLFGTPGKSMTPAYAGTTFVKACVAKEFTALATGQCSPVTEWLTALARALHGRHGGPGVGVVGMCFTGGFALAMMVDPVVVAPVLSQPSLPLAITKKQRRDLGLSPDQLRAVSERAANGCPVLGLRFTADKLVPPERFERLRDELGEAFIAVEIDSSSDNPHGIPRSAHSVLAGDFKDEPGSPTLEATNQVLDFLAQQLEVDRT